MDAVVEVIGDSLLLDQVAHCSIVRKPTTLLHLRKVRLPRSVENMTISPTIAPAILSCGA
jgi:hypothetical protein